jgi:hypothetical protein
MEIWKKGEWGVWGSMFAGGAPTAPPRVPFALESGDPHVCLPAFFLLFNLNTVTWVPTYLPIYIAMVRHKKDNFSRGGKKFSNPRPRPVPRGDGEDAAGSSRPAFKAACWDMGHCDPKRCSGKRLMKLGLMRELHIGQRFPGVIVSYANPSSVASSLLTDRLSGPMRKESSHLPIVNLWNNMALP